MLVIDELAINAAGASNRLACVLGLTYESSCGGHGYDIGRFLLSKHEPDRTLYLAVTKQAYSSVLAGAEGQELISTVQLKLLVFDPGEEAIEQWI